MTLMLDSSTWSILLAVTTFCWAGWSTDRLGIDDSMLFIRHPTQFSSKLSFYIIHSKGQTSFNFTDVDDNNICERKFSCYYGIIWICFIFSQEDCF